MFSDLALSKRLERAEGNACLQFAEARRSRFPESGAEWMQCAGAFVVFDGAGSPVTQTFGLGLFEELTPGSLDTIERFFLDRGAEVCHEVSPFAGLVTLKLLCGRHYQPIEISNVMYIPVEKPPPGNITVRVAGPEESQLWSNISARGWAHEHPELRDFIDQTSGIAAARPQSPCFLAELDGQPGAAGALFIHEGVALFAGAATVPEMRRRGLQAALLQERMRYAFDHGCDLAYTRLKWRLESKTTMPECVIVSDPEIMSGMPCFRGTRVPFKNLMDYLEGGHSLGEFLLQFPSVTLEMAVQALKEAKDSLLARIA